MEKKHYRWLDLVRSIAVFLVMYGHMVQVTTYTSSIPEVFSEKNALEYLPLIPPDSHIMHKLEMFFMSYLHTQTAIVGVCLFFILAGYLTVSSKRKYGRKEFLLNRCVRLFPVLWAVTILCIIVLHFLQGFQFGKVQTLAQLFMVYPILQLPNILGITWTLGVEIFFYIIIAHTDEINEKFIMGFNLAVMLIIWLLHKTGSTNLEQIVYFLKFIPIILIGAAVKIAEERKEVWKKTAIIGVSIVLAWLNLNINKYLNGDVSTYPNLGTCIVVVFIFGGIYVGQLIGGERFDGKIPKVFSFISKISYACYLIQVAIGFNIMYLVKKNITTNAYVVLFVAVIAVLLISYLINRLIEEPAGRIGKKLVKKIVAKDLESKGETSCM